MGSWKAVRPWGGAIELYDIEQDIDESDNIAAEHPEIASKIETYLRRARTESEHWPMRERPRRR